MFKAHFLSVLGDGVVVTLPPIMLEDRVRINVLQTDWLMEVLKGESSRSPKLNYLKVSKVIIPERNPLVWLSHKR